MILCNYICLSAVLKVQLLGTCILLEYVLFQVLHYKFGATIVLFTPLHLLDSYSY